MEQYLYFSLEEMGIRVCIFS